MQDFKNLDVWHKAHSLALRVYAETATFPSDERFGIVTQLRRAAVSVPANIAEGSSREGDREFGRYLVIASASTSELECLVLLSRDLGYLRSELSSALNERVSEVRRMIAGLRGTLDLE